MTGLPIILIVDDEPRSLEALERILEDDFDVKNRVQHAKPRRRSWSANGCRSCSATSACRTSRASSS